MESVTWKTIDTRPSLAWAKGQDSVKSKTLEKPDTYASEVPEVPSNVLQQNRR